MGGIRFQAVVSFSSQDPKFPVENLLRRFVSPRKCWLCSPTDKSGMLEAVLQLERASYIHYLDIGNYGSYTVEVKVGRSLCSSDNEFFTLLPSTSVMNFEECKNPLNTTCVRMFSTEDFDRNTVKSKWDRVKVICCQPYTRGKQFGLSFLHLSTKESVDHEVENEKSPAPHSNCDFKNSPLFNQNGISERKLEPSLSAVKSRGLHLLSAAKKQIPVATSQKRPASDVDSDTECECFEEEVLLFVTSKTADFFEDSADNEENFFKEYVEEFEKLKKLKLNDTQKEMFEKMYYSVFPSHKINVENSSPVAVKPKSFYSTPSLCSKKKKLEPKENSSKNTGLGSDCLSFDIGFETSNQVDKSPVRRKIIPNGSAVQETFAQNDASVFSEDVPSLSSQIKSKFSSLMEKHNSKSCQDDEFVQFDGSKPGPSKEVTFIDCPICDEPFHVTEIEAHASSCGDLAALNPEPDDDAEVIPLAPLRNSIVSSTNCHVETFVECPVCGNMFQQAAVLSHANVCIENFA